MRKGKRIPENTNRLYVLTDSNGKALAISEDQALMAVYILQFSKFFIDSSYERYVETVQEKIDKLLDNGSLLLLQPLGNFVFTEIEYSYYDAIFKELFEDYRQSVSNLISFKRLMKLEKPEEEVLDGASEFMIDKLQSYSEFIDNMDIETVVDHILLKPYMSKYYYNETAELRESLNYKFWKED